MKNDILALVFHVLFPLCEMGGVYNIALLLELYFSSNSFVDCEVICTEEKTQEQNKLLLAKPSKHEYYKWW